MKIIKSPKQLQKEITLLKRKNKTVGLVPTMGALHDGHQSLIKKSVSQNDITVVSVYVNPIQFGPNEDYLKYPRPVDKDIALCKKNKVDFLFMPTNKDLYSENFSTYVSNNSISKIMCGVTRPIHFQGVTTVVSKLFNIACPDRAYFGLKDYQQYTIIKQMITDLNFNINIVGCPIVREKSGLAMSSRNTYLNEQSKIKAANIYKTLVSAKKDFSAGKSIKDIFKSVTKSISSLENSQIDYVEIRDSQTLAQADKNTKSVVIAVAVKLDGVRLIDNIVCKK